MKMLAEVYLKSGHTLTLVLPREIAEAAQSALNHEARGVLSGVTLDAVSYSVRMDDVSVLLVQTEEEFQKKVQRQYQQQAARHPAQQSIPMHGFQRAGA